MPRLQIKTTYGRIVHDGVDTIDGSGRGAPWTSYSFFLEGRKQEKRAVVEVRVLLKERKQYTVTKSRLKEERSIHNK